MKKIINFLIVIFISTFAFILNPKALDYNGSITFTINGGTFPTNTTILVSTNKTFNINLTSKISNGADYFIRFEICNTMDYDNISFSGATGVSLKKTDKTCIFTGDASGEIGRLFYLDLKFVSNAEGYFGSGGTFYFTPMSGQYQQTRLQLMKWYNVDPSTVEIENKIDNTNNKLDDLNNNIKDDNIDTSSSNSFFEDFDDTDHGGLSSIITAPLSTFMKITETCEPINVNIWDKDITLPCGDTLFWNKPNVQSFRIIWNILLGGPLLYALLLKLYHVIENLKNPDDDRIEVAKL